MVSTSHRPTPVVGLVLSGAILVLLEGVAELVLAATIPSALTLPGAFVTQGYALAASTIFLAAVLWVLVWAYTQGPPGFVGVLFVVLGALSFPLGAGFLVGGVLIVVGGALAVFAEGFEEWFAASWMTRRPAATDTSRSLGGATTPPSSSIPTPVVAGTPGRTAGIVLYRTCPRCGELVRRDVPACNRCGAVITPTNEPGASVVG